ncbi:MAG TPA: NADPH-dependent assimilatory sulfite reductase hemoprotein subunit [Candidatus Dormibacteraeota bacterium]
MVPNPPFDLEGMSKVEAIKAHSNQLRGELSTELKEDTKLFTEDTVQVLKFHGVYQQDDRDLRKEARKLGLDKHYQMMIRTRIPGGIVSADAYLAHDRVAGEWGNGTLRVTTRQDFQLHGVLKGDLKSSIRAINETLLTTLGGCGDQERNIMCCPAPVSDRFRGEVLRALRDLVHGLTPTTQAYNEIWLDGELAASNQPEPPVDELYGERYLPRKFKTAVALEGDNCVDVYANDLALIARRDDEGGLAGFDVLVGGGLGRTANKPDTWPAVALPLGFVVADRVVDVARAVVGVQRDYGDRTNRRHARLKYTVRDHGIDWFREQVETRTGFRLEPTRPLRRDPVLDHLGWHDQGDGSFYYGLYVENGRIQDSDGCRLRSALTKIVEELRPQVRLTAQQNVILANLEESQQPRLRAILAAHGVTPSEQVHSVIRNSMACPAWPTCGLAVAESERAMPTLIRQLADLVDEIGLADEPISWRMTGCPNGCARPYLGDVGFVGTTLGKYDVYLGGDPEGTRLNSLYARNVPIEDIPQLLRGPLSLYALERGPGVTFGDWVDGVGVDELSQRVQPVEASL